MNLGLVLAVCSNWSTPYICVIGTTSIEMYMYALLLVYIQGMGPVLIQQSFGIAAINLLVM